MLCHASRYKQADLYSKPGCGNGAGKNLGQGEKAYEIQQNKKKFKVQKVLKKKEEDHKELKIKQVNNNK